MRLNGGIIGVNNRPTNRAASGVWKWDEQYINVLALTFPTYYDGFDLTYISETQAIQDGDFSVTNQELTPLGMFMKSDGTKMYVTGASGDDVNQYSLSTPWDITTASFDNVTFSVSGQDSSPVSLFFKSDGTKMYLLGGTNDNIFQYTLSSAWDISTASYDSVSFSVTTTAGSSSSGLYIKPDGSGFYVCRLTSPASIYQYTMATPWDMSTASYDNLLVDVTNQLSNVREIFFKNDGTKMYASGAVPGAYYIFEYDLNTAWQVASINYNDVRFQVGQDPGSLYIKDTGDKLFYLGINVDRVYQVRLGTLWSVDPNPTLAGTVTVTSQESQPEAVTFKPDGTKMYVVGPVSDNVHQYSLSTSWDVTSASFESSFTISSQETTTTGIAFKPDGTKMFIVGQGGDGVDSYDLGTPWDITSAVFERFVSLSPALNPDSLYIRNDGIKLYVTTVNLIYEFTMSTPWDTSTLSQTNSYNPNLSTPHGISFSNDGSKLFILENSGDLYQFFLATSWDISTASPYTPSLRYRVLELGLPTDLYMKPDGTQMFIAEINNDNIVSIFLGP